MTAQLHRRSSFALFSAWCLATAIGLAWAPAFDPLAPWARGMAQWAAGLGLGVAAGAAVHVCRQRLARHAPRFFGAPAATTAMWLLWGAGAAAWATGALQGPVADGRVWLWLVVMPLWLAAAGLWQPPADASGRPLVGADPQRVPHGGPDIGVPEQGQMGRGWDVKVPRAGQAGAGRRKDDVVAMAPEAEEQPAA